MTLQPEKMLEIGKLYYDRGDYVMALPNLESGAQKFLENNNFDQYLTALRYIIRIHAERADHEKVTLIKEQLHDLVIKEGILLSSKMYYTLGLCSSIKGQPESAVDYFKKGLEIGLKNNNQEDMCYAILGLSISYRQQKKHEEALKEIYNLNIFLNELSLPELRASAANSNARILMDLKKYDQALDVLWTAYEEVKNTKQLNVAVAIMTNIGVCLFEIGQKDVARIYLNLANKTIDESSGKIYFDETSKYLKQIDNKLSNESDLVFDLENHAILEKNLGKIDFKNQFILLDLLKLFVSNQGQIFSKEYLVENIWKQNYDPEVHDNKIYVTIKRLRKMIEPDYDKPKYLFRAKNGYYLSKSAKVKFNSLQVEGSL